MCKISSESVSSESCSVMKLWRTWKRKVRLIFLLFLCPFLLIFFVIVSYQSNQVEDGNEKNIKVLRERKGQYEYIDERGIHVIVGYYMGNLPWDANPNLTEEIINANGYSPMPKAGEMGEAYFVLPSEKQKSRILYDINKFNLLASDRIPVNRSLPDERQQACREKKYDVHGLPKTSVIIVFHNEAWSTLLRTIHSVINRSPERLLHEIILVDDASTRAFLGAALEKYVSRLPTPVKLIRAGTRTGLIRARLLGAKAATGDVLTFLDAHCECSKGWLEPLLALIAEERTRVVCPVIDIIHDDTFAYLRSFELHWGAFNWDLHFRWYPISERERDVRTNDSTLPFKTPVMAGGLFAIDKSYFKEIGTYDEKMDIWGGENIELSFRVWQCGGSIEIVPCSHVGHVFRKASPYTIPGGVRPVLYENLARAAATWMDEWKFFYFKINPDAGKLSKEIDISSRLEIRQRLKCKSFKWYLENIWPEHFLPADDRFFGKIKNLRSGKCIEKHKGSSVQQSIGKVRTATCIPQIYPKQLFIYTKKGQIMTDESLCLDSPESVADTYVVLLACSGSTRQKWKYDPAKQSLIHIKSSLCLEFPSNAISEELKLQVCNESQNQRWMFESVDWKT